MRCGVSWSYYDRYEDLQDKYLPPRGEGETMATQAVTAVCKLIYKWYNDGDVFDNVHLPLEGWVNDLSSYANWLDKYLEKDLSIILGRFYSEVEDGYDYEYFLKELADKVFDVEFLENLNRKPKTGSIYNCQGRFKFSEYDDYDDWRW